MVAYDKHSFKELSVFSRFAGACGLTIQPDSIEKRDPPEPDILCRTRDGVSIAFELVELVDRGFAQRINEQIRFKELFEQAFENLPANEHIEIKKRFGNALIHLEFRSCTSSRAREQAVLPVFSWLQELAPSFTGISSPEAQSPLHKIIKQVTVQRADFVGPCFDIEAAGPFADPTIKSIRQKFNKKYATDFSIELLAYYELQPVLPDDTWLPQMRTFILQNLEDIQFDRVWVYDMQSHQIKFRSGRSFG